MKQRKYLISMIVVISLVLIATFCIYNNFSKKINTEESSKENKAQEEVNKNEHEITKEKVLKFLEKNYKSEGTEFVFEKETDEEIVFLKIDSKDKKVIGNYTVVKDGMVVTEDLYVGSEVRVK